MTSRNVDVFVSVILSYEDSLWIEPFVRELHSRLNHVYAYFEIILVDDHCRRMGAGMHLAMLRELSGLRYLRLNRVYGEDIAITAGLETAIGDVVVVLDPYQDPVNELESMVSRCVRENIILYGIPNVRKKSKPFRNLLAKIFEYYCKRYLRVNIQTRSGIFRVFNRSAVNVFMRVKNRERNLRLLTSQSGYSIEPFFYSPIVRGSRAFPVSNSIFEDLNRSFDILVSTSQHPLRWLSRFALGAAGLNLLYGFYILIIFLFKNHVSEGWTTISLQSAIMFFLLFLVLTVLSEYVGKILSELHQGPLYTVEDEVNSSVTVSPSDQINIYKESTIK